MRALGQKSEQSVMTKYAQIFEKKVHEYSKEMFAYLGLHHWTRQSKAMLFMFSVCGPLFLIVIGTIAFLVIQSYNKVSEYFYESKLKNLE